MFWSAIVKIPSPVLSSCDLLSNVNHKILTLALLQVTWAKSFLDGSLKMNKQQALRFKIPHRHKGFEKSFPPPLPRVALKVKQFYYSGFCMNILSFSSYECGLLQDLRWNKPRYSKPNHQVLPDYRSTPVKPQCFHPKPFISLDNLKLSPGLLKGLWTLEKKNNLFVSLFLIKRFFCDKFPNKRSHLWMNLTKKVVRLYRCSQCGFTLPIPVY